MSALTVVRRLVRRSVKPLVMAAIAGSLALSLVVTTPSNAQAFVPPILPVVAGATTMAMPSLLATSLALHPVGWTILGLTALGVGLYASKDYWLPYVTGEFGKGNANVPVTGVAGFEPGLVVIGSTLTGNGNDASVNVGYTASGSTTGWTMTVQAIFKCQRVSDGVIQYRLTTLTQVKANRTTSFDSFYTLAGCYSPSYKTVGWMVGGGYAPNGESFLPNINNTTTPVAFSGNTSSATGVHGPSNIMRFGDLRTSGFDPRSDAAAYRVEVECIAPDGKIATATAHSLGSESGIKIPSCEAAGLGHGTGAVKVFTAAPGFAPDEVLWETKRPTEDPAQPLCSPTRPTSGCKLGVLLDGKPCVMGSVECENWSSLRNDPNYSTRLSCQYGPYAVAIETCNPLERAYEPGGSPATEPNVDGNPATRNDTMPNGTTQPKPDVGVAPGGFPSAGTNPDDPCLARAWSWNPADFVKSPVLCAMKDAFVPKMDIQARSNELKQNAMNTVPIAWLGSPILGPSGSGCPNWTINVAGLSKNVVCDSSFTAALLGVRGPLFILVAAAMVWPLIRGIWYASIPVLRVNAGSSK